MTELALFLVAVVLLIIVAPFAILTTLVMLFIKDSREKYPKFSNLLFAIAYSIDVFGNVFCSQLFNITLIKHGGYQFGERRETVSSVLGKNKIMGTLSKSGRVLAKILDSIDENHCINSIEQYKR
jgi:hypothetical protein